MFSKLLRRHCSIPITSGSLFTSGSLYFSTAAKAAVVVTATTRTTPPYAHRSSAFVAAARSVSPNLISHHRGGGGGVGSSSSDKITRTMASSSTTTLQSNRFWNREESTRHNFKDELPVTKEARIISLSTPGDRSNTPLHTSSLPSGATIVAEGTTMDELNLDDPSLAQNPPNVIFVSAPYPKTLAALIDRYGPTSLEWIHARSAGLDAFMSESFRNVSSINNKRSIVVTNAKGSFSSTLAEYTMLAIGYFAKDLPRLLKNKHASNWEKYDVLEIRGTRLGIVGYGDIGRAAAKLAVAYGMKVTALRRNPNSSQDDPYIDICLDNSKESLNKLFAECDYVLCSAPLTDATRNMIGKEQFDVAKKDLVFINVGRGPIVNEDEMIAALKDGRLRGVGLDVFATEPLDPNSELWALDNVLLSPHNMDQTRTFMEEASEFFVEENLPRFLRGLDVLNEVNPANGY